MRELPCSFSLQMSVFAFNVSFNGLRTILTGVDTAPCGAGCCFRGIMAAWGANQALWNWQLHLPASFRPRGGKYVLAARDGEDTARTGLDTSTNSSKGTGATSTAEVP